MNIFQMGVTASVSVLMLCAHTEAADIFGLDLRADNEFFTTTTDDFVGNFTIIGGVQTYDSFAMDLDLTATTLHAVLFDGLNTYGTIDVTTGAFTPSGTLVGVAAADNVTGLSVDPTTGSWYITTVVGTARLYVGDITTGVFASVGPIGFDGNIDLAIDSQGNAYGHDILADALFSIDLSTGAGTAIGPTGQAGNFAQGMDFDYSTDTLYATLYTGGGTGSFGFFDLNTGLFNVLQDTFPLNAEMEMVIVTTISDCPWDLDGNGTVGVSDLLTLLMSFGPCGDECPADFNDDGVVSAADLLELLSNFGACPGSPCIWDVNGDGVVDQADLDQVVQNMGPCKGCPEDVNGDGMVNGQDVAAVATHFGPCP